MQDHRKQAGFREIAKQAGVSVTTAERVLNERGSVSEHTRTRVLEAARELRVRRFLPEPWHGITHIEVILPANRTPHWRMLEDSVQSLAKTLPRHILVHRTLVPEDNFAALEQAVLNPKFPRRGLVIAADAAESITPAIKAVMARGEHVVTLATDVPDLPDHDFSGIDNLAAGRTAGFLMERLVRRPGPLLVLPVHTRRQEHRERIAGFSAVIGASRTIHMDITHEVPGATAAAVMRAIAKERPAGIYATGHDSQEIAPILSTLRHRPIWITHERTALHMEYMKADILDFVIDQDSDGQARWALHKIISLCLGESAEPLPAPKRPEMRLYLREHLG